MFTPGCGGMPPRGFPHWDIPDSCGCTHLVEAYRSVPRPSSAHDAKASTVRPYSLPHSAHLQCLCCSSDRLIRRQRAVCLVPLKKCSFFVKSLAASFSNATQCLLKCSCLFLRAIDLLRCRLSQSNSLALVETRGLEPLTFAVQRRRSPNLSYVPALWEWKDSNLRPLAYQANALTS